MTITDEERDRACALFAQFRTTYSPEEHELADIVRFERRAKAAALNDAALKLLGWTPEQAHRRMLANAAALESSAAD